MFYLIVKHFSESLESWGLGFLRVFTFPEFQALLAVFLSFVVVLAAGPRVIRYLQLKKIGDRPDFDEAQLNAVMNSKAGTPTMGGVLILCSIGLTVALLADISNFFITMALVCGVSTGALGAIDDWLKLTRPPGSRQGLSSIQKLVFQVGLALLLSYLTYTHGQLVDGRNSLYFPFVKDASIHLPLWGFLILGTLVIVGSSNAVNLTDGLDGLAAGCMCIVAFSFLVLSLVVGLERVASFLFVPYVQGSAQMAVVAGAMLGACLGFLWFNCNPAKIFMGDTGSLALGALIGYTALVIRQELILVIIGGIFVAEALSVIIQVGYFKYTKRRYGEGRRVFLMAPLHHHFQKKGWGETQVVVRFWVVGAILAALALATLKVR
jgi:phospho-N-acetylmuramoyl-pentapeptide-transferase